MVGQHVRQLSPLSGCMFAFWSFRHEVSPRVHATSAHRQSSSSRSEGWKLRDQGNSVWRQESEWGRSSCCRIDWRVHDAAGLLFLSLSGLFAPTFSCPSVTLCRMCCVDCNRRFPCRPCLHSPRLLLAVSRFRVCVRPCGVALAFICRQSIYLSSTLFMAKYCDRKFSNDFPRHT